MTKAEELKQSRRNYLKRKIAELDEQRVIYERELRELNNK